MQLLQLPEKRYTRLGVFAAEGNQIFRQAFAPSGDRLKAPLLVAERFWR